MRTMLFRNARLAFEAAIEAGELLVRDGKIAAAGKPGETAAALRAGDDCKIVDCGGGILAPGFIDLHCHGGSGGDVNDGEAESYRLMAAFHLAHGVTSYLPSLSVDPIPKLEKACAMVRTMMADDDGTGRAAGPEILGVHFESPYISMKYKGCQAAERILPFDENALSFIKNNADVIRRITAAPELPGVSAAIPRLRGMNIVVSGGHSDATAEQFRAAADRGMTMATHLYNAMSQTRKEGPFRVPGVLEAALTDDRIYAELIADGVHVPPELITVARRCKGPQRLTVCSDASRATGLESGGTFFICGQEAIVENGVAMLKDRSSLASSVSALDTMVRVLVTKAGFPPHEALAAASAVPARAIGADGRKGFLKPGYDADIVLLDGDLNVKQVLRGGTRVI